MTKAVLLLIALYSFPIIVYVVARDENCGRVIPLNGEGKYSYSSIVSLRLFKRYDEEHYLERTCVGSIISKRLILTTASCFTTNTKVVEVKIGSVDGKEQTIKSENWKLHKNYNKKNRVNDLAVIKLNGEIKYDQDTKPSCLPKISYRQKHKELKLINFDEKLLLNGSIVGLFDVDECENNYPHSTHDKICVLNKKAASSFKFLHGIPLLSRENRREITIWSLVGILSSFNSSSGNFIFTNVSYYLDRLNEKNQDSFLKGKCGVANIKRPKRQIIYGNEVANPDSYPWMVYLKISYRNESGYLENKYGCGAIIHRSFILTAAHLIPSSTENITIYYGSVNVHRARWVSAIRWPVNLNYDQNDNSTWDNDIALIEVGPDSIDFQNNPVGIICLPEEDINIDDQTMTVAGWGNIEPLRNNPLESRPILREASVIVYNSSFFPSEFCIGPNIPAIGLSGFASYGDSGSPLFLERHGMWTVVGVCARNIVKDTSLNLDPTCPIVFTRVSNHLDWIYNIFYGNIDDILSYLEEIFPDPLNDSFDNDETHSSTQQSDSVDLNHIIDLDLPNPKHFKHDELK